MSYNANKANPFGGNAAGDEHLYGQRPADIPSSGRKVSKPIALNQIIPDRQQPRKLIPAAARRGWNGQPEGIPAVLMQWQRYIEERLNRSIPVADLLRGGKDIEFNVQVPDPENPDKMKDDPVAKTYLELIQLAGSIAKDGLLNAITISQNGTTYTVETGERRLLAHHMLYNYLQDDQFAKIPAEVIDRPSVWRQAVENNARVELTAIGKARQLAILIMAMYQEEDGMEFESRDNLETPEGSDRPFYAQVADGNEWRIKRGYGDRIQDAMGLTSRSMLSNYRNLLKIPDWLWIQADEEDWAEFKIRTKWDEIEGTNRAGSQAQQGDMSPTGDISEPDTPATTPPAAPHSPPQRDLPAPDEGTHPALVTTRSGWEIGDRCHIDPYGEATITGIYSPSAVNVRFDDGRTMSAVQETHIEPAGGRTPPVGTGQAPSEKSPVPRTKIQITDEAAFQRTMETTGLTRADLLKMRQDKPEKYADLIAHYRGELDKEAEFAANAISTAPYPVDDDTRALLDAIAQLVRIGRTTVEERDQLDRGYANLNNASPEDMRYLIVRERYNPDDHRADLEAFISAYESLFKRLTAALHIHAEATQSHFEEVYEQWKP